VKASAADVMALRKATGFPVLWCKRWLESAPDPFLTFLKSNTSRDSRQFHQLFHDLHARGIVVPCPVCGAAVNVDSLTRGASCAAGGLRHFGWSVYTSEHSEVMQRMLKKVGPRD
jgi:hypothetical protein